MKQVSTVSQYLLPSTTNDWLFLSQILYVVFMSYLLAVIMMPRQQPGKGGLFTRRHGRRHRLTGALYLLWINLGFWDTFGLFSPLQRLAYHAALGVLGVVLTLTAAFEFQHKHVRNVASGTLDEHATVTHGEMLEHSFYQGVNLVQVLYLHALEYVDSAQIRVLLALLATSPWLLRGLFPVNRFSDNYLKQNEGSSALVRLLYRVKKWQYVFYKHFLLHGLCLSLALRPAADSNNIVHTPTFRLYWVLLNLSYVMEFFLQSLVKRRALEQHAMLALQQVLMAASTVAALAVLRFVNPPLCLASLALNFAHRKHDVVNTCIVAVAGYILYSTVDNIPPFMVYRDW